VTTEGVKVDVGPLLLPQPDATSAKVTGLAQKLGQLEVFNRDLQSKAWANLKLLGQPCNFRANFPTRHGTRVSSSTTSRSGTWSTTGWTTRREAKIACGQVGVQQARRAAARRADQLLPAARGPRLRHDALRRRRREQQAMTAEVRTTLSDYNGDAVRG
jgi:hypothetical protein